MVKLGLNSVQLYVKIFIACSNNRRNVNEMEPDEVKELMAEIGKAIDKSSTDMWLIYPTLQCYDTEAEGIPIIPLTTLF